MKRIHFTIILLCFGMTSAFAQNQTDIEAISTTITNYYEGYIHRDIDKLNKAFDTENGTMKVPIDNNDLSKGFRNRYFSEVVPKWGNRKKLDSETLANCKLEILNIDVESSKIASGKMLMKVGDVTYIDILSLHKIGETWKITNKIYHVAD
ncbi:nuclear transport factor 2 family protein [Psychroserpens sp.]|uniref:nuclear transport factor 2 family protein n=1 Tax=Psychroserpens sp. TaxID=2020870 RepID=UPI001B26B68D|nr:nuclear transport factor 2 family protein [Psychroserpens sp.]MBO6607127.1 nuclear transport factor 2 family protein [Psychroserpens sp.]MBO6630397.1 nuclear transport factor 2 family protein [Psychroserpens sp.]MBO6654273.1 nuclear transport factor 2 family protein [Psychroserpens sp.]MBO6682441.1 nuclear transport factor 2 family protein [Psychroserpens sp.]MBO6750899.1 nuclear transport factor 2 family protein [Psychroserpens sp.]